MLTALFNFVWNAQKNKWTTFFECPGKEFLSIENVLKKIWGPKLNALPYWFSPHFWERGVTLPEKYNKTKFALNSSQSFKAMVWWWWIGFCGMVDRRKAFSLISSRDHCQRSSPSWISDMLRAEFEPAQNLSSCLVE